MTATLIILLVILALVGVSLALGRTTREAQIVRDDEFVELEGSWIRYRVAGEGPPVLLVHGLLASSRVWEPLIGRLSERFTVYSLDLRGFGESDKPLTGYGVRHGSRLLHSFCSRFGLGKVALVGHDIGGDMAVKLAADHPELARSVTLVATPANEEQMDLPTSLWLATLPVIGPLFYALGQHVGFVRKLWMKPFVSDRDTLPEEIVEDAAASTPAAVRSTFNTVSREISRDRVARQARNLRTPMLVIAGEEDQIVDPQAAEVWSGAAPRLEVALLEGCGHLPMIERPEEFNARLLAFLTGDERYLSEISRRPVPEEVPVGEPRPAGETGGGIDGLEPDEEASAAEPYPEESPRRRRGVFRGARDSQEDETGDMGYAPEASEAHPARDEEPHGEPDAERPRRSGRREGRGEDLIPELPDDLFRWSDVGKKRRRGGEEGGAERTGEPGDVPPEKDYPEERG